MYKNAGILTFLIFVLFIGTIHATESVTLVLDEAQSLQSGIDVLVDSKALNFGQYDPNGFSYFVRVSSAEINLLGGSSNNVELSLTAR
ncbi:MAG: hypothetical protein Q7J65_08785, partial [Candidatus Marinimicrobia bacterium]|nr:hypothetical protein [Candidatus Neomarinimicrobiota bacterium]